MTGTVPELECDLIMKGGITSGVVYPAAIVKLSNKYRFRNIGGASAEAIAAGAAGAAAAAEYGRQTGASGDHAAMKGIAALPDDFAAKGVLRFFQPHPELKRLFDLGVSMLPAGSGKKAPGTLGKIGKVLKHYYPKWVLVVAIAAPIVACLGTGDHRWFVTGLLAGLLVAVMGLGLLASALFDDVMTRLPAHGFGLCSGKTVPSSGTGDGLTDWLYGLFNRLAGLPVNGRPLTFRDLDDKSIHAEMMTTCLSMGRPYRLPIGTAIFHFEESEFRALFPDQVVNHMIKVASDEGQHSIVRDGKTYWPFPGDHAHGKEPQTALDLPVVVAARMSLSFPILIQAVPLYAFDRTLEADELKQEYTEDSQPLDKCWFSDGGISSNFPIHFFDSFLPERPTFGISLGSFDKRRVPVDQRTGKEHEDPALRIFRAAEPNQNVNIPITPIGGLADFFGQLLTAAKDWQDTLLSELPGYRERIVTIQLNDEEGGLNLTMDETRINNLRDYGAAAGDNLVLTFNFDEHRWRRFLVTQDRMTAAIGGIAATWPASGKGFGPWVRSYDPQSYRGNVPEVLPVLADRIDGLCNLSANWTSNPPPKPPEIPKPDAVMRITPKV